MSAQRIGLLAACLKLALIFLAARALAAPVEPGPLLIAGGEFSNSNPGWARYVAAAGGQGASVLVIPTASGNPMGNGQRAVAHLRGLGLAAELVPLTEQDHGPASDPAWVAKARSARGIWFLGGDQGRITGALLRGDGTEAPLLTAIRAARANGAIIGGSSAGAAIMSKMMFKEGPSPLEALRDPMVAGVHTDRGLGFIDDRWLVDQHVLARGRVGRMIPALRDLGLRFGVGVEEDTAILVTGTMAEVVGSRAVVVVDMKDATMTPGVPVSVTGVRLSLAAVGDTIDLATGHVTTAAVRAGSPLNPGQPDFNPYYGDGPFSYADMLGPSIIADAMTRVLDSRVGRATGLGFAIDGTGDAATDAIGFRFQMYRDAETRGYYESGTPGGGYTVIGMRLDIRPVAMARPLYRVLER